MPISDCEVRDPRIRRTRQLLQGALRTLMQTKSLDEISVQDITDSATVNRATFYDHYTDKFALLDAMVAGGFHALLHQRQIRYDGTCPSAASALILATCDYITQSHASPSLDNPQSAFEPLIDSAIIKAIQRVLLEGMPKSGIPSGLPPELIASSASWAIFGAVKEWFRNPGHGPSEEVVPLVLQLVMPLLQAADPLRSAYPTSG